MDSEAQITQSLANVIAELALVERSNHDLRNVIGLGLPEAIRQLYPDEGEATVEKFADRYRHYFLAGKQNRSILFDGAMDVIKHLHADDYLLAVATGKSRLGLDRSIAETNSGDFFHITRCADETHSKPHPQMLLEIMTVLDVAPEQTVMIGDTEYDLQMAAEAGTASLGVTYGVHAVERLQAHQPLACLDNISEVGQLLYKD